MKLLPQLSLPRIMILAITLLGLALGGATELWQQAVLALATAALIWAAPPKRTPGRLPDFLLIGLFLLALGAFLPAVFSTGIPWRRHLLDDLHLALPFTRTPQPWLTLQACGLLLVGLVWADYVLAQKWTGDTRLSASRWLVFGVAVLASVALLAFTFDFHVPNWNQEENRGWFPNRNQTADVLAVCGVINYALVFDCLRKKRASLYLWLCTLAVLDAALVVSYSRAGILMFFGGIALWHAFPIHRHRTSRKNSPAKWTALSLAFAFVLLTLFFVFGGNTLERFEGPLQSVEDNRFRWAIQRDALSFSTQTPVLGVGLGNFEPLFASAREASANADRAIHPESDWLWAASELGWFAPLIFALGIFWWLRRCLVVQSRPGESLRRAMTVAGILFILHGLVDVSAHRLGSLFVGLLVFSMALPSSPTEVVPNDGGRLRKIFRGLAVAMVLIAAGWLASTAGAPLPATTATLDHIEQRIDDALAHDRLAEMGQLATDGLKIAPLSWHLYFQRAYAETFQPGRMVPATNDFMIARSLESRWVKPCYDEGATWLAAGQPDLCMDAWEEALRRANSDKEGLVLYSEMLSLARPNEMVHADLMTTARGRIDYELVFLGFATKEETQKVTGNILARDPGLTTLTPDRREKLFAAWWSQGDREQLVTDLTANQAWLGAGWFFLAQSYANQKDFQDAWKIVAARAPVPIVPNLTTDRTLDDLQRSFYDQSDNLASGILLYLAQTRMGKIDEALSTLRVLEKKKDCPKYVFYLEATLWAQRKEWELAWTAWWNYHEVG